MDQKFRHLPEVHEASARINQILTYITGAVPNCNQFRSGYFLFHR